MSEPSTPSGAPLRVLFINDTSRNGGPGKTLLDIVKFVDPAQIDRTVLVPREGIVSQKMRDNHAAEHLFFEHGLIEHIFAPLSRPVDRRDLAAPMPLKLLRAAGNVLLAAAAMVRLARRVKRARFDVIFCNGTMANFVGGALGVLTGTKVIWHVLYISVGATARGLHARLAANRNVKAIVCVSRPTARQFDAVPGKIRLIHDAIDIEEFDAQKAAPVLRKELGLDEDVVLFGSHGRILRRKGYIELVRAARQVFDRLGTEDRARCRFVIVGDTPQDQRTDHLEECRMLARELDLNGLVEFIGFRAGVTSYVADFDIAVVPSVYEDPLPLAVLELMAMSKPVVAFDVGGMSEMITNGVSGKLAPGRPSDIAALADACLEYFHDAEMRRQHGIAGRRRIEQDFNARTHARRIQDELLRVAGRMA